MRKQFFFYHCMSSTWKTLTHSKCLKNIGCLKANDTTKVREITNTDSIIMKQCKRRWMIDRIAFIRLHLYLYMYLYSFMWKSNAVYFLPFQNMTNIYIDKASLLWSTIIFCPILNVVSVRSIAFLDLTKAEDIKKRWQEYTEELYKKDLHDPDNHDGKITQPRARHPGMWSLVGLRKHHDEQN